MARFARLFLAAALGFVPLFGFTSANADAASSRQDLKNFQHVFVIMMENTGYDSLIGNPNAPWINQAVAKYVVAIDYFGVSHPCEPNYIAATSG